MITLKESLLDNEESLIGNTLFNNRKVLQDNMESFLNVLKSTHRNKQESKYAFVHMQEYLLNTKKDELDESDYNHLASIFGKPSLSDEVYFRMVCILSNQVIQKTNSWFMRPVTINVRPSNPRKIREYLNQIDFRKTNPRWVECNSEMFNLLRPSMEEKDKSYNEKCPGFEHCCKSIFDVKKLWLRVDILEDVGVSSGVIRTFTLFWIPTGIDKDSERFLKVMQKAIKDTNIF